MVMRATTTVETGQPQPRRRVRTSLVVLAVSALAFAACSAGATPASSPASATVPSAVQGTPAAQQAAGSTATIPAGPITFGLLVPFTGQYGYFGNEFSEGAQVAAAEINAGGGILGHQVQIANGDTVSDPIDAVPALNKLINVDHIVGVIGPQSPEIGAVLPIIDQYKLPDMFQGGSTDFDHTTDPWLWRASPSDSQLGVAMALYAWDKGYRHAALMFDTEPSAQTLAPVVASTFKALGGTVVAQITLTIDQTSYRSEVQTAISSKPDVIFTSEDVITAGALFTDFQQANGLAIPFVGTDSTTGSDFIKAITPAAAHKALTSLVGGTEPGGGGSVFNTWYAKTFTHAPLANASYAYDGVMDLAIAIEKAGTTDGAAVVQALPVVSNPPGQTVSSWADAVAGIKAGTKINYDGASGPMDFNQYHNVFGPFDAIQYDSTGTPSTVQTFTAAQLQAATK
jgi:branched-chain amino acid transport system substrate-binding protein